MSPFSFIYDKKTNKWHKWGNPWGRTIREFGHWVAGSAVENIGKGKMESPGRRFRRRATSNTGLTPDAVFEESQRYCPGILFFYNIRTKKQYTITTAQGDSEIVLIEGDNVYYRIVDSLYKAEIKKDSLGDTTLLVKDELVHDIHWAFMGPPYSQGVTSDNSTRQDIKK